ncbi:MAG: glutaredoxin domain-containing protein [Synechococcaceae cyanobacterium ELA263]
MKDSQKAKVDVYTSRFSPECMKVKALLDRKEVTYNEFFVDRDEQSRTVMLKRTGGRTSVPQIFINGRPVGGFEELDALEDGGQLDLLLSQSPPRPRDQRAAPGGPHEMPRPRTSS